MKLRNKKTGLVGELYYEPDKEYHFTVATEDPADMAIYKSLAELNEEWEDYKPVEPLIKNEKIRKAVRVWAEVNKLEPDYEVRYSENSFSLISWQACIEFNTQIDGLEHDKKYTVTELCGEDKPRPVIVNDIKYSSYEDYLESRKEEE